MTFRVIGHDVVFLFLCFFYPDESTWHGFWRNVLRVESFFTAGVKMLVVIKKVIKMLPEVRDLDVGAAGTNLEYR